MRRTAIGRPVTNPEGPYQLVYKTNYRRAVAKMVHHLGGLCAICDMTNLEHEEHYGTDLELDHIDPAEKSFNPKARWLKSGNFGPGVEDELAKCQALCHECHLQKTVSR